MTPERRKRIALSSLIICAMVLCLFLSMRSGHHRSAWNVALLVVMVLNLWFSSHYQAKHKQPDTLIHLFPANTETSQERS
jgi:hypothetical protein